MSKRNVAQMSIQNVQWTDDTSRKSKPCGKCQKPTTGRVAREARCMDCTIRHTLSPIAGLVDLLQRNADNVEKAKRNGR